MLIGIVVLVLSSFVVIAPPPVEEIFTGDEGIEIEHPAIHTFKKDSAAQLNFHLFNVTTGAPILNESTRCDFHLYNHSGNHTYTEEGISVLVDDDFEVRLNEFNFTQEGSFSYVFKCNSSTAGGFVTVPFEVTESGFPKKDTTDIMIFLTLFGVLFFVTGIIIFFKKRNNYEEQ